RRVAAVKGRILSGEPALLHAFKLGRFRERNDQDGIVEALMRCVPHEEGDEEEEEEGQRAGYDSEDEYESAEEAQQAPRRAPAAPAAADPAHSRLSDSE